jgi:RNA polymerase sigma-70 factor (ECF subfamily)
VIRKLIQLENKLNKGFRLLMAQHQEIIYAQVRGVLKSHDDTADVVQNVFVKVYGANKNSKENPKFRHGSIALWLMSRL